MFREPRLRDLYQAVRSAFESRGPSAHGWEHVRRVIVNAAYIGREEKADMSIVMPAIILHDIGFVTNPDEPKRHPEHGARECHTFLTAWDEESRDKIARCILVHKAAYPGYRNMEPETLEEKVVCDADQLDKFGWIGLIQMVKVYAEYGSQGIERYQSIPGIVDGLRHLSSISLFTETGRRRAEELRGPEHLETARKLEDELDLSEGWNEDF